MLLTSEAHITDMKSRKLISKKYLAIAAVLLVAGQSVLFSHKASAASLTETFVMFNRLETSTPTTGTVCAEPTTAGSVADVAVTFPTGYTLGAASTFTTSTTNLAWPTGGTAWPTIQSSAASVSGQTVTWTSGSLSTGTLYCFNWTNSAAVSTASSTSNTNTGTVATETSGLSTIDSGTYTTSTISNDQVVVTATVLETFSFALSGNTDALGTLSTSSVASSPTPRTVTVNTNAKNGWQVWAKDSNTGLSSASNGSTIASTTPGTNSTLSAGTAGYNMGVTQTQSSGTGTITVATPFVGGSTGKGGGLNTTLATVASSGGTASSAVLTLTNNAAISATTPAASDYTDTITVVGAGMF